MQRLIGKKVTNIDLGEGIITKADDSNNGILISVDFPDGVIKRYGFPIVLGKALSTDDEDVLKFAAEIVAAKEEALRKAEENREAAEEQALKDKSKSAEEQGNKTIANTDRKCVFSDKTHRIFKVHQGRTFDAEYAGGYVWAPQSGIHHHEKMREIKVGDIIFHYADGAIVAVGEAMSNCFAYPQPSELYGHGWGKVGYRVEIRYQKLARPFTLDAYRTAIISNRATSYSSFDSNGDACQGYMYELEIALAELFASELLRTNQPSGVIDVLKRIK